MKSHSLEWTNLGTRESIGNRIRVTRLNRILRQTGTLFTAAVAGLAMVVGAAWAISVPEAAMIVQATVWASGFVFLALAIEAGRSSYFSLALASGLALPVLAVLASRVAGEFLVLASALLASWVAYYILKRA